MVTLERLTNNLHLELTRTYLFFCICIKVTTSLILKVLAGPVFTAPLGRLWSAHNTMLGEELSTSSEDCIGDPKDKFPWGRGVIYLLQHP
jgi:hypothetical protein